jgi:hypothetical protein
MRSSLAINCVCVEIVFEVPENLSLLSPSLSAKSAVGLTSVVYTRRAYTQRRLLLQTESAQFSHGNRPGKSTAIFRNIAWEKYCNIAEKQ